MTKLYKIEDIVVTEGRQRQEFEPEAMQELFQSIEKNGLLQAPGLRNAYDQRVLVFGERRLRTVADLHALGIPVRFEGNIVPPGMIPCTNLSELSPLQAEEIELDENLKRKDLTWQEHAAAVQRLHNLRTAQLTTSREELSAETGLPAVDTKWTVADTTRELYPEQSKGRSNSELGSLADGVRKEILVAQHLDNPVIAKAKSTDEAFKLLKREEERKRDLELAASVGASFNASIHELHNANCLHWMDLEENRGRFDVILTDPPYGMGADSFGDGAGRLSGIDHQYDDSYEAWQVLMRQWAPLSYAVAAAQAHAYVFCDIDRFHELKALMQSAGWYVFRTPFIVHKINSGRVPLPDRGPRRQYEILLYAIKGNKPVTHIYPDVLSSRADESMSHGAQKPVAVYQDLLSRSVRAGDTVLDCFAGSGTIFPAAHTFKCKAVGLELNPEYYAMGLKRLQTIEEELNRSPELEGLK
jgi:site-specific DNA-methyltransferase (adenine-specific)